MSVGNSSVEVSVAGRRKRNGPQPVTGADYWHIGSIGKSVTALLVASLFEQGSPKLDCKLASIFPDLSMNSGWEDCTIY